MEAIKNLFTPDGYFVTTFQKITLATWIAIAVIVITAIVLIVVAKKTNKKSMSLKTLVTGALCLAVAFILSYIRIIDLPQGGAVTLFSMMPLIIFSYIYGTVPGLLMCFSYSLLQIIQGAYIVHPIQFLLDYPLAFTLIGLSGVFKNNIYLSTSLGYGLRYGCHVLSGIVFFASSASEAGFSSVLLYSALYNSFAIIEMVMCLLVLAVPTLKNTLKRLRTQSIAQ